MEETGIDIIVEPGTDIEHYIKEAAKIFPFEEVEGQSSAMYMAACLLKGKEFRRIEKAELYINESINPNLLVS